MRPHNNKAQQAKISREFSARLSHLKPQQKIHAIVMLETKDAGLVPTQPRSRAHRQAILEAIHHSAEPALKEIDSILEGFDGKRLAEIDALGCIPVETTAAGLAALAASKHVKAILEDQPISLLTEPRH
jgi:hypothetical protein